MAIRDWFRLSRESRGPLENPATPISQQAVVRHFGMEPATTGIVVTPEKALSVPAVWGAVNFLSGTLAGLCLDVYRETSNGKEQVKGGVQKILHDAVNDEMTSFNWRKYTFERLFTDGRALTYIERGANGKVANLFPIDPKKVIARRISGSTFYDMTDGGRTERYRSSEIIDLRFYTERDGLSHRSPLHACAEALAQAIALQSYGARFFNNGGVPLVVFTGPFTTPGGLQRGGTEMSAAIQEAAQQNRPWLALPNEHKVEAIGIKPADSQMVEVSEYMVQQVARIYSLPPMFVQDLSNTPNANSEQQDLHLVKHTLKRWAEEFEQELNLKLFGRGSSQSVELDFDDLLRGDYKTRMEGHAQAVQNGIKTPNEVRKLENLPDMENGNDLMGQAQLVKLGTGMKQGDQGNAAGK